MARLDQAFSVADLPADVPNELIKPGWYEARIAKAELALSKSSGGQYIKLQFKIADAAYSGRVAYGMIHLRNKSIETERIGLEQLGSILSAIGLEMPRNVGELVGWSCGIKVATKAASGDYKESNEVKGYRPIASSINAAKQEAPKDQAPKKKKAPWPPA